MFTYSSAPELFRQAQAHHAAGRLPQAEALYRQILTLDPRHANALHFLGLIAAQVGRNEVAADLMSQSVALLPNNAGFYCNLGGVYRNLARREDAIAAYQRAVALDPNLAEAHQNLANVLKESGRINDAINASAAAVRLRPQDPVILNSFGTIIYDAGQTVEALAVYQKVASLRPDYAAAHKNTGIALQRLGRLDEAAAAYRRALTLSPDDAATYGNLGLALLQSDRLDEAAAAYRDALRLQPDSEEWKFQLAACTGDNSVPAAPLSHIRDLFDKYAPTFDAHLLGTLGYQVPQLLRQAIVTAGAGKDLDVLDLGCGTGLCGMELRSLARRLVGVDLSPAMAETARLRGIYDEVLVGELAAAMRERPGAFDLLTAGDVFIYVGQLDEVFAAAAGCLRAGGLLAFTVEKHAGTGFVLQPSLRYAHSSGYLKEIARQSGFSEVSAGEVTLRREGLGDVSGLVVVLRKG